MSIKSTDIGSAVMRELQAYTEALVTEADNAAKRSAKRLKKKIEDTSPEDTGAYANDWSIKEIKSKTVTAPSRYVVHNKEHYRLTHLLEYGHATKGGTERVKAQPHIEPARDEEEKNFLAELESVVSTYGH